MLRARGGWLVGLELGGSCNDGVPLDTALATAQIPHLALTIPEC